MVERRWAGRDETIELSGGSRSAILSTGLISTVFSCIAMPGKVLLDIQMRERD